MYSRYVLVLTSKHSVTIEITMNITPLKHLIRAQNVTLVFTDI